MNDLYEVGTMSMVGRMLKLPEGAATVWLQGEERVRILEVTQTEPFYKAKVQVLTGPEEYSVEQQATMRSVLALFEKVCPAIAGPFPGTLTLPALNADKPGWLADLIASSLNLEMEQRQEILETLGPHEAAQRRQPPPCPRS